MASSSGTGHDAAWRITAATLIAWLPSAFAVVAAAADWNAYIVLACALGGLTITATLAAVAYGRSFHA